jgi:hypothetical protein
MSPLKISQSGFLDFSADHSEKAALVSAEGST